MYIRVETSFTYHATLTYSPPRSIWDIPQVTYSTGSYAVLYKITHDHRKKQILALVIQDRKKYCSSVFVKVSLI